MGARPIGCVLGLALPRLDEPWLAAFADGFHALAAVHGCPLIGGDTTRSAHDLAISVTVFGAVPAELALRRDGARADDDIWVSGELGAADVAYRLLDGQYPADPQRLAATRRALEWPEPQVAWAWRCAAWRGPPSTSPTACCRTWATSWPPAGWARRWTTPACPWPRRWTACRGPAPARHPGRRRRLPALLHRAGRAPRRGLARRPGRRRARHAHRPRHGAAGTHGAGCAGRPMDALPRGYDHFPTA